MFFLVRYNVKNSRNIKDKSKIGEMFLTSFAGRPLFPSMPGLPCKAEEIKHNIFCYIGLNVDPSKDCDHQKCLKDGQAT